MKHFHVEERPEALLIRFDRPPVNAITVDTARELGGALEAAERMPAGKAVVMTGTGTCFSAGLDLKVVPTYSPDEQREMLRTVNRLIGALYALPRPVVAAVNGHAMAGGLVLALACDVRVCTSAPCRIALTEVNVGIPFPAGPMTVVLAELPPQAARLLTLTGDVFDPARALAQGIVDEVVPPEQVLPRALERAAAFSALPGYPRIKAQLRARTIAELMRIVEQDDDPMLHGWL
jgi:enoyl-CoA hydratase